MVSTQLFNDLVGEVYRHTGVTVEDSKKTLLSSRIGRRVRALGLEGPEAYLDLLRSLDAAADEVKEFIDVVTTHKTSFFRTKSVWDWLENSLAEDPDRWRTFDAWSCACSNGQEAYSLAMTARQAASTRSSLRWSVTATDVSQMTVDRAMLGSYKEADVEAILHQRPSIDLAAHFYAPKDESRAIRSELKAKIRFSQHNLLERKDSSYDIAFLRNVLIYFTESDKARVVQNVLSTLRPGGILVIGESESLLQRGSDLEYVGPCIYQLTK